MIGSLVLLCVCAHRHEGIIVVIACDSSLTRVYFLAYIKTITHVPCIGLNRGVIMGFIMCPFVCLYFLVLAFIRPNNDTCMDFQLASESTEDRTYHHQV